MKHGKEHIDKWRRWLIIFNTLYLELHTSRSLLFRPILPSIFCNIVNIFTYCIEREQRHYICIFIVLHMLLLNICVKTRIKTQITFTSQILTTCTCLVFLNKTTTIPVWVVWWDDESCNRLPLYVNCTICDTLWQFAGIYLVCATCATLNLYLNDHERYLCVVYTSSIRVG